ncbi:MULTISPECIES: LPD7 domain-containing protein [unclassified Bradyrhizobium]|uniref:LPD7 domain-containing protein n=1 Tax=unclassified Bradyrhizobium TaxID=2631580 RepID=UPI0024482D7F|nr:MULTISPECIES: LPD7 domain-containing protein [unclassified Bradyrhizobium]MDH2344179.1 hypothetical protein [Bradyrhizobium sp. SSUT77]MDH2356149.1 hypothetical protein [Bradyrhizobium sp. SSUT112]
MHDRNNDREDFSLERQDRTGSDPGKDRPVDHPETKSAPVDKSASATLDHDALPERIRRKYYVVTNEAGKDGPDGEARLYADERGEYLAFKITEDRLITRLAAAEVIRDMVSVAQHRQWEAIHVRGSVEFRREAWLEAGARGIEVQGYQPTELDRQALADRQEVWNRTRPRARQEEVRSASDRDEPTARLDYDEGVSGRVIELGRAPYGNRNNAETSTYVAIELDNGQRHKVWGVGLEKAIADSKAGPGDRIQVRREGVERVLKTIKVIDPATGSARTERRQVPRNRWRVTAETFRSADRQTAASDAELVAAQSQMVVIEKVLERLLPQDERARQSIMESVKDRIVGHLERGQTFARATVLDPTHERHRPGLSKDGPRHGERARTQTRER